MIPRVDEVGGTSKIDRVGRAAAVLGAVVMALVPMVAMTSPDQVAEAAVAPKATTNSALTVAGTGPFSSLRVTADQTDDLVNQAVEMTWEGASSTVQTASGTVLGNYLHVMQCWAEPGQQPTREQCQFGGFVDVPNGAGNIASRQITQAFEDPNETEYTRPPGSFESKFVRFESVDGTVETTRRSQFFDAASTNEIPVAKSGSDGKGRQAIEMQTGLEAPGLGCGQQINGRTPDCFLVVVPRDLLEVDGRTVGATSDDWLYSSPLTASNWVHRLVLPLKFREIGGSCSFGRPETPTVGSDFVTEAVTSWQPILCGLGDRNFGFTSLSDDTTRKVLSSDDPSLAFVNSSTSGVEDAVYAPVSISALTILANVERRMPFRDSAGKPVAPDQVPEDIKAQVGLPFTDIKLTPRLLAKLMTQSYAFDKAFGTSTSVESNPFDLSQDPDFLAINPDFTPQGYKSFISSGVGRMFVVAGLSDSASLVWRYIVSDSDARSFLSGKPDPWGMVLNDRYKGLVLPTNSFPRADLGCVVPASAPAGFTLPNCTLDVYPYAGSFSSGARQVSRGEANRRDVPRLSGIQSYGLSPNQTLGQRSLLALSDSPSAARYHQVSVKLRNANGDFVAPTDSSMAAAVASMSSDVEGVLQPNVAGKRAGAYPLTVVTYAATVPGRLTEQARQDYARLLEYVAGDGQVRGTTAGQLPAGYLPLTSALKSQTAKVAAGLSSYTPPTPTPSPTATVTPTSTVTPTVTDTESPFVPTDPGDGGTGGVVPTTGEASPTPAPSTTPPTESPTTTPVVSTGTTPADAASANRLALLAALVLGAIALFARAVLPWIASRRT